MKLVTVVGARPHFIKSDAVSRAVQAFNARCEGGVRVEEVVVHTGQHFDHEMSKIFFDELGLAPPAHHLGLDGDARAVEPMVAGLTAVMSVERPDAVVVYGDTDSTLAGGVAAERLRIPVAHVEAGLRSFNASMPEETNRIIVDRLSTWLFCPTATAVANLRAEGITRGVHQVGDVMHDVLHRCLPLARPRSHAIEHLGLAAGGYYLATVHRAENADASDRLAGILSALGQLDRPVVFPCHPRTRARLEEAGIAAHVDPSRVRVIDPVGYFDMLRLESEAACVLTDSGGVQREAYWLGVPCITLRSETEWPETVADGWNIVAGHDPAAIAASLTHLLDTHRAPRPASPPAELASERIVRILATAL
jgi:UDP-N-acetylglucosamine 2-epimerase